MFAIDEIKDSALIKSLHLCTRTYMSVFVCQTVFPAVSIRKIEKCNNRETDSHTVA